MNLTPRERKTIPLKDLWRLQEIRQKEVEDDFNDFIMTPLKLFAIAFLALIGLCLVIWFRDEIDQLALKHPVGIAVGIITVCLSVFVWVKLKR